MNGRCSHLVRDHYFATFTIKSSHLDCRCNVTIVSRAAQEHSQGIVASAALESLDEVDESGDSKDCIDDIPKELLKLYCAIEMKIKSSFWHLTLSQRSTACA